MNTCCELIMLLKATHISTGGVLQRASFSINFEPSPYLLHSTQEFQASRLSQWNEMYLLVFPGCFHCLYGTSGH